MNSTAGQVTDAGYTAGFYRETAPSHLAFAALVAGRSPGRALRPQRVLELGFGQGFGLALLAAANPDVEFQGYDYNADHVAHAQRLIDDAGLGNVAVSQIDFEQAVARGGERDVDVIVAHGVLSWVSHAARDAMLAIIDQRLRADGLLYVSYNCMPGWAPVAPIRQLMLEVKRSTGGDAQQQLARALDFLSRLKQFNAGYFANNPLAGYRLDAMLGMDRTYLAHEYLAEHWDLLSFSEVAALLSRAELSFAASATLIENLDQCVVPQPLLPLLAQTKDPVLKETLRDFIANKWFRRDVFVRGNAALAEPEHRRLLSAFRFILAVPRGRVELKFAGPLAELIGKEDLYRPIVDRLAHQIASFDQLLALPVFGASRIGVLLECLTLLVHSGQVFPVPAPVADVQAAQRFNRMIAEQARAGRVYGHLACPLARTGIPVSDFGLLTFAAVLDGVAEEPAAVADYALAILKRLGRRPLREGVAIDDDGAAAEFLAQHMRMVVEEVVPVWRRLGAL